MRSFPGPRHGHPAPVVCACGWAFDAEVTWLHLRDGPVDPVFGLALWLQAPVRGEVLWAYNREHLDVIRRYVAADLRERTPNRNASLVSRLPAWIKAAKNREAVLAALTELEAR